jgi:hypothetical protein
MKRNNKKSVGLNMRGGLFGIGIIMAALKKSSSKRNQQLAPVAQATQPVDPLVHSIVQKVSGNHTAPDAQTDGNSLANRMRMIRTAIESIKLNPKSPDYKSALSTMRKEKQKLKKETLGQKTYKQVKKDMVAEKKRTMKQSKI